MLARLIRLVRNFDPANPAAYPPGWLLCLIAALCTHVSMGSPINRGDLGGFSSLSAGDGVVYHEAWAEPLAGNVDKLVWAIFLAQILPLIFRRRLAWLRRFGDVVVAGLTILLAVAAVAVATKGFVWNTYGSGEGGASIRPSWGVIVILWCATGCLLAAWRTLHGAGLNDWITTARTELVDARDELRRRSGGSSSTPPTDVATS